MSKSLDLGEIERRPDEILERGRVAGADDGLALDPVGQLVAVRPVAAAWGGMERLLDVRAGAAGVSGVASIWATKKLKTRITFPRAGYVAWNEPTRGHRLAVAAVAVVSAAIVAALLMRTRAQGMERVGPPAMGALLSLAFVVASLTQRAPHMLALAGVALMLGLAFGALNVGWQATNWMLIGVGTATFLSGSIRLGIFLKQYPLEKRA